MKFVSVIWIPGKGHSYDYASYEEYIEESISMFPDGARNYVLADWHYDHTDFRCLHDATLQAVGSPAVLSDALGIELNDPPSPGDLEIHFAAAYQNAKLRFSYRGIASVQLNFDVRECGISNFPSGLEVLTDEVIIEESTGLVSHEIKLWVGSILVSCSDFDFHSSLERNGFE